MTDHLLCKHAVSVRVNLVKGIKVCGAVRGGCVLLMTDNESELLKYALPTPMRFLEFSIDNLSGKINE